MARAVIGGLITSTLLTLLVVPVAYTYLDDFGGWVQRKLGARGPTDDEAPVRASEPAPRPRGVTS